MQRSIATTVAALGALTACSGSSLEDARYLTGSSTIVADAAYERVAVVNTWEGSVSLVDVSGTSTTVALGETSEPTRVARAGDRFIATLRGQRAIAEIDAITGDLVRTLPTTGPEPYGIVATEAGDRVYVSISQGNQIEERDGDSLEVLRTFDVPADPRWLALRPQGDLLVVGHGTGEDLTAIDLEDARLTSLQLPTHFTSVFDNRTGTNRDVRLAGRVTGDPGFTADGTLLAVPAFFADNTSGEQGTGGVPSFPYYAAGQTTTLGRFNAAVVLYRTRGGSADSTSSATQLVADFAGGGGFGGTILRSYLTSVTPSPDGLAWLTTMEASDAVLLVDATPEARKPADASGIAFPNVAVTNTGRGPRGLALLDTTEMWTHTFLSRGVQDIDYGLLREEARAEIRGNTTAIPVDALPIAREIAPQVLTDDQQIGAGLFYSAADATMGAAGVSCSTCHFEGRTDGLTWALMNGERQTPSLAGNVSATAPVTWTNDVPTVAEEAQFTASFRMGSQLGDTHAGAIESFVDFVRLPDLPEVTDTEAIARGKAVFEREDVGCATCHTGDAFTDNAHHDLYGLEAVNTPTLLGIAATAPYLHDGSAQTLRDVLIRSRDGRMGDTSMLSDAELNDLETYLQSL